MMTHFVMVNGLVGQAVPIKVWLSQWIVAAND